MLLHTNFCSSIICKQREGKNSLCPLKTNSVKSKHALNFKSSCFFFFNNNWFLKYKTHGHYRKFFIKYTTKRNLKHHPWFYHSLMNFIPFLFICKFKTNIFTTTEIIKAKSNLFSSFYIVTQIFSIPLKIPHPYRMTLNRTVTITSQLKQVSYFQSHVFLSKS